MTDSRFRSVLVLYWGIIFTSEFGHAPAAERNDGGAITFTRQVTFRLTYANRDLIWLGDPASPTASAYIKPEARPIATDVYVTTIVEDHRTPVRHYFREARIAGDNNARSVYAFTPNREKLIGIIDEQGRFAPNKFYESNRELLPTWPIDASILAYDSEENALYSEIEVPGPQVTESIDFLPLVLSNSEGDNVTGRFSIDYAPSGNNGAAAKSRVVSHIFDSGGKQITLAKASVPTVFRRAEVQLGSFDNHTGTYLPEAAYRAGASQNGRGLAHFAEPSEQNVPVPLSADRSGIGNKDAEPSVTVEFSGEFTTSVQSDSESLVIDVPPPVNSRRDLPIRIAIDGKFDDWRNVAGVDDRRGDLVPYLEYVPDVDLLEFKAAHDDQHIYLYARVAGQVGRSHPAGGRSYFYAYMDVDRNPGTGFVPTRDDDCYFGVDIGDDCEVQFEFVNNKFRKSFYGFCGLGGDKNVLKQTVTIGKSQYGRFDESGVERANYKSEYIYRNGVTKITEDLQLGTSDTIRVAISPDGSEVEVASTLTGFLKDSAGQPTLKLGQTIDLAAGMECDSKAYLGKTRWAADSTMAIRGYRLDPSDSASAQNNE
jgi:hypothetical protein